eukprot:CAMPEP_0116053378 /NCGR_PEP_ID=MMETSP0322-20121206/2142_1 /TAXON_ID=163516 /ORGANISM="Leptocylindrus danicus var. apora, Strain B651" /LENGTH=330 /DNA_ID=CAMNT_0003536511 /DNA_START=84 /DNA_END=1073 /DNA_ORIENTATION=+
MVVPDREDSESESSSQKKILYNSVVDDNQEKSTKSLIGNLFDSGSDWINENKLLFRYATFSSIAVLGVYGLLNTPFFFRFKDAEKIPAYYFKRRKKLHCRIVHVVRDDVAKNLECQPIRLLLRHLTPLERCLSRPLFDSFTGLKYANESSIRSRNDLLCAEIAGVVSPPPYSVEIGMEEDGAWLKRLAEDRSRVTLQLLSLRSPSPNNRFPSNLEEKNTIVKEKTSIIGHITYRPGTAMFQKDLASSLVLYGRADLENGLYTELDGYDIEYASTSTKDIDKDVEFVSILEENQAKAIHEKWGMWSDKNIRQNFKYKSLVEEVETDKTKTW